MDTITWEFYEAKAYRFDNRPWDTVEEMDMEIIRRWNRKVRKEDHVYVPGDFVYIHTKNLKKNYTTSLMTHAFLNVIVDTEKNRATGSERKGNAADTYVQFQEFKPPV